MQMFGDPFKNPPPAVAGPAARLLRKKGQRCGFAHKAQLAIGFFGIRRIHIDAAVDERTVKICNKCADISGRIRLSV